MKIEWANTDELVRCNCDTPLLKRVADRTLEFVKSYGRKHIKVISKYYGDRHDVKCGECGGNFAFIHLDDSFKIGDEVAIIKVPITGTG